MRDPMKMFWERAVGEKPGSFKARRYAFGTWMFIVGVAVGHIVGAMI